MNSNLVFSQTKKKIKNQPQPSSKTNNNTHERVLIVAHRQTLLEQKAFKAGSMIRGSGTSKTLPFFFFLNLERTQQPKLFSKGYMKSLSVCGGGGGGSLILNAFLYHA